MPTPSKHALLSASSAYRWLACTAAPHFEENFPDETSIYAEEGTLAHSFCELFARKKFTVMTTRKYNAELKKLKAQDLFQEEMLTCAESYVEYLAEKAMAYESMPHVAMEVKVDLSEYVPEGFGTCDCIMVGGDTLQITDYKHGKGVAVSAEGNPQMKLYALGALKLYGAVYGDQIKNVTMAIFQPRLSETANEATLTVEELLAWGESIEPLAQEAFDGPGEFHPGDHCRFCKGKALCKARANENTALSEFTDFIPEGEWKAKAETTPVEDLPPMLSDEEVGEFLVRGQQVATWMKHLQEYAASAILNGANIPGWKMVEGRSIRAFSDFDGVVDKLIASGVDEALIYDRKPKTLSEIEKMLGKKTFAELLSDYVVKPPGKPTLAPESDKRKAYNAGASEFEGV